MEAKDLMGLIVPEKVASDDLPVRLERAEEDKGRRAVLREMANASERILTNAVGFYHRTVKEMVTIAAGSRRLQRQFRMAPKDIVAELQTLGVVGFGVELKFSHLGVDYAIKHYPLTTANLAKVEEAFSPLIRPMEISQNGRVIYAPTVAEPLTSALADALLASRSDLVLDGKSATAGTLQERISAAVNNKALPQGQVESLLRSVSRAADIAATGEKVVHKDGKYTRVPATQKEKDRAADKLSEQTATLMDKLVLTDEQMRRTASEAAAERSQKSLAAKKLRATGEDFTKNWIPLLEEFGIETLDDLRAMLVAARANNYTPDVAREMHAGQDGLPA